jgi:hypothetical protein
MSDRITGVACPVTPAPCETWFLEHRTITAVSDIGSFSFSPDGRRVAICSWPSYGGVIQLFDTKAGTLIWRYRELLTPLDVVAFSPTGRLLATGSSVCRARILDAASGRRLREIARHDGVVSGVAFSPDGRRLATSSSDGSIQISDVTTGGLELQIKLERAPGSAVVFGPDGSLLATSGDDGFARVWDARIGQQRLQLRHGEVVTGVAFSPDGSLLATSGDDGFARVWDARTGQPRLQLHHGDVVTGVAFSPDGSLLATSGDDGFARVWDASTGQRRLQLHHGEVVTGVAFSPDTRLLATSGEDRTLRIWLSAQEDIPADIAGRVQDDVAASQPPNRRQAPPWSALRAVLFGAAGAMLGAAAYGTLVILTQREFVLASVALGAIVAYSVGLAGAALRPLWIGAISVVMTLLSLLLSEYVIARHFGGLTNAPLVLSPNEAVTLIRDDLAINAAGVWIWGVALLFACGTGLSRSRIETESARDEDAAAHPRAWRRISGRGAWLGAALAFATGLVAVVVLAAVPLGPASQDPAPAVGRDGAGQVTKATNVTFSDVKVGDCYNNTPNSSLDALPEVPCLQPHDNEVFFTFTMSPGKYPGDDAVAASADQTCVDRLPDHVGDSPSASLVYSFFVPDQLNWDSGDRSVICYLARSDSAKLNRTTRAPQ